MPVTDPEDSETLNHPETKPGGYDRRAGLNTQPYEEDM